MIFVESANLRENKHEFYMKFDGLYQGIAAHPSVFKSKCWV